ncbi:aminotransferase class I/II-fold pyridoxal phosphate-dependent enzyme [Streptomyces sp. GLT-R25]
MLINTPHNPTGTVLTREELTAIAELAVERDLLVITDEVYEHLVFDEAEHIPLATLPGMRGRTVTIGSAGKSFSFTGWKVGWVTAAPDLVAAVRSAKQFLTYVASGPFQYAVAEALALPDTYFEAFRADMRAKRDLLGAGLAEAGFTGVQAGRHVLHHHRHPAARRERRVRVLPRAPRARGRGRHPERRLLRPPRRRCPLRPLRLLQADVGPGGGGAAPQDPRGLKHSRRSGGIRTRPAARCSQMIRIASNLLV